MRRFGYNRNGSRRHRCPACARTFTDEATRPTDQRRLSRDKAVFCLRLLLEGNSVRSTERLTGVHRDTILHTMTDAGAACQRFLERVLRRLPVTDVQADELWGFVGCKEKTRLRRGYGEERGDAWCFVALDRPTRMVVTWHVAKRTPDATLEFAEKLRRATTGRFQLTTDGFTPYRSEMPFVFGPRIDFAQLVKVYASPQGENSQARYSPGDVVDTYSVTVTGEPDEDRICTSHAERGNLTLRMQIRRLTRLTNAHSKKWENHEAAMALFFAYYDFCRPHQTLTEEAEVKTTPAMKAGLTDHVWSVEELLATATQS